MLLPEGRSFERTQELLKGAIDIHVHAGPHLFSSPRRVDPVEAAIQARDAGMRAIVFMDVFEMSNGTAWSVNRVVRDFQTFGGLILNTVYGGMNPRAVRTALHYGAGATFISFGAHSTYFQASREGHLVDGQFVPLSELYPKFRKEELDRCIRIPVDEEPGPELDEILSLIAEHPHVYLNTGHVSVSVWPSRFRNWGRNTASSAPTSACTPFRAPSRACGSSWPACWIWGFRPKTSAR